MVVAAAVSVFFLAMGNTAAKEKKANVVVTSFAISKHNILVGQAVTVTIGLLNNGTADATNYLLNLTIDDAPVNGLYISLGMGNRTTYTHDISPSQAGNHTVSIDENSTYLHCYERFNAGDYRAYQGVGYDSTAGSINYNYTAKILSSSEGSYSEEITYTGIDRPYSVNTYPTYYGFSSSGMQNFTIYGMESVETLYGVKNLTHYSYTYDNVGYHFIVNIYADIPSNINFRAVTTTDGLTLTEELVDTNLEWLKDI